MSKEVNKTAKNKNQGAKAVGKGQEATKKLTSQQIVFIVVAAVLAVTIIASSLFLFIPLINDSREKNFSYLTSDLSYYLDIPDDVYKNITLSIDIARPKEGEVDSAILYFLAKERAETPLYDGAYQKDVVIDAGDTISFWYRAYTVEEGKEIDYATNFAASTPATLVIGEGSIFAHGLELAIVNEKMTPNDTPAFTKITEVTVAATDVVYVSYTELEEGAAESAAKKYSGVRIDLGDTNSVEMFGEGLISAVTGAAIGGAEKTAQSEKGGKTYNYTNLKVDFVTRCEGDPFTLSGYFPYDFTTAALRNKTVYFDLYIQGVVSYETPEFDDAFVTDSEYCFLYTTGDNSYDYLNDIADVLAESEEGTVRMISSEYGYNVVMKYPIPEDAVTNTAYEDWFGDLTTRVVAKLFHTKCEPYMERVAVSNEEFANLPSMKQVSTNFSY